MLGGNNISRHLGPPLCQRGKGSTKTATDTLATDRRVGGGWNGLGRPLRSFHISNTVTRHTTRVNHIALTHHRKTPPHLSSSTCVLFSTGMMESQQWFRILERDKKKETRSQQTTTAAVPPPRLAASAFDLHKDPGWHYWSIMVLSSP